MSDPGDIDRAIELLDQLADWQRIDILSRYCIGCGRQKPAQWWQRCTCHKEEFLG